jgi:hypothetical protein
MSEDQDRLALDDGGVTVHDIAIADAAIMLGVSRRALLGMVRVDEIEKLTYDAARGGWFIPSTIVHRLAATLDLTSSRAVIDLRAHDGER